MGKFKSALTYLLEDTQSRTDDKEAVSAFCTLINEFTWMETKENRGSIKQIFTFIDRLGKISRVVFRKDINGIMDSITSLLKEIGLP